MAQKIVNGPGRFDLMLSLFTGSTVTFSLQADTEGAVPRPIEGVVQGLTKIFHDFGGFPPPDEWIVVMLRVFPSYDQFRAKYNSRTREGELSVS